jgi:release factor glutamine methyltransferase
LALEIGIGQGTEVAALFAANGFEIAGVYADLGGVDRVLLFKQSTGPEVASQAF